MKKILKQSPTLFYVLFSVIVFYVFWLWLSLFQDIYLLVFYPLYVTIALGLVLSHRYRHRSWDLTPLPDLLHQLKMMRLAILALIILVGLLHLSGYLAFAILLAMDIFCLAGLGECLVLKNYCRLRNP